jgi:hypothetical protein
MTVCQQQQLNKLSIIFYYLDKFNHNRSLNTPRALGQTALQLEPLKRASLLPGLLPGYIWLQSHTTVVYCETTPISMWWMQLQLSVSAQPPAYPPPTHKSQ